MKIHRSVINTAPSRRVAKLSILSQLSGFEWVSTGRKSSGLWCMVQVRRQFTVMKSARLWLTLSDHPQPKHAFRTWFIRVTRWWVWLNYVHTISTLILHPNRDALGEEMDQRSGTKKFPDFVDVAVGNELSEVEGRMGASLWRVNSQIWPEIERLLVNESLLPSSSARCWGWLSSLFTCVFAYIKGGCHNH